jgi:hypothetical protein
MALCPLGSNPKVGIFGFVPRGPRAMRVASATPNWPESHPHVLGGEAGHPIYYYYYYYYYFVLFCFIYIFKNLNNILLVFN